METKTKKFHYEKEVMEFPAQKAESTQGSIAGNKLECEQA